MTAGLRIKCCGIAGHGKDCGRYRATRIEIAPYGRRSAEVFLAAWLRGGEGKADKAAHKAFTPTQKQMAAAFAEL